MKHAAVLAACLLGASAVSWARALSAGSLAATGTPALIWPLAALGALAAIAGAAHLRYRGRDLAWPDLVRAAAVFLLLAALSLPLSSNDLWSNIAYGRMAVLGCNPWLGGPAVLPDGDLVRALVDVRWATLPLPYGPLIEALAMAPGAAGARSPWLAMALWKAMMAAAALASVVAAARFARARYGRPGDAGGDAEARARFVRFAWCPLLAWELAGQAHNDAILVLCLVGFVAAATAGREPLAIAWLALGVAAKFVAAPVAGLYLVVIARRSPARAALYAGAIAALTIAGMLPWWHGLSTLSGLSTNVGPQVGHTARSIGDLLYWAAGPLGGDAQRLVFHGFSAVGLVASIAVGAWGVWRTRSVDGAIHASLLFFLCSDLFAQTWFQPWYATWLLPLALAHPDRRWSSLVALYAALTLVTYAAPIDPISNVAVDLYIGWRAIGLLRDAAPA